MASPELLAAAMRHLSSGAWSDAEATAHAALVDDPSDPRAALLFGLAIAATGAAERAAAALNRAGELRPGADHPCVDLARMQPSLPRRLVTRQFRSCLRLTPSDVRLRLNFAAFLLDIDHPAEAEKILAGATDASGSHHLMGLALMARNASAPAIVAFEQAVALNPLAAASWSHLGSVLAAEGSFDAAIAALDRAVALEPDNPRFRFNRAVALLRSGQWLPAWQDYDVRRELTAAPRVGLDRPPPTLRPGVGVAGQTVLVVPEDDVGDTMLGLRYLPLLVGRRARVVAYVPRKLAALMRAVPGVAEVVSNARRLPVHDFVCPLGSLPGVFTTTVDTIPALPDLGLDAGLLRRWSGVLPPGGLRVGLVWADQSATSSPGSSALGRRRGLRLTEFAPLLDVPGATFVSLQAGPQARQKRPPGAAMVDPMRQVSNFADLAALIAGLDVVVGVDSAAVHLAGLARKPVFLLDRYDGSWRWLHGRADSPWYPTMTIFRQEQPGDWAGAMARAAASLQAMAVFRGFGSRPGGMREPRVARLTAAPIAWREAV